MNRFEICLKNQAILAYVRKQKLRFRVLYNVAVFLDSLRG